MDKRITIARLTILSVGIIYLTISILALISVFTINTNVDLGLPATIENVLKLAWYPFLVAVLFVMTFLIYSKNKTLGAFLEIMLGIIFIINAVQNNVIGNFSFFSLMIYAMLPFIFVTQGISVIVNKQTKRSKKK